jgi:hypothetical protein
MNLMGVLDGIVNECHLHVVNDAYLLWEKHLNKTRTNIMIHSQ